MNIRMPNNFMWGGASSAHQIEGGYDQGGKGLNIMDVATAGSKNDYRKTTYETKEGQHESMYLFEAENLPEGQN